MTLRVRIKDNIIKLDNIISSFICYLCSDKHLTAILKCVKLDSDISKLSDVVVDEFKIANNNIRILNGYIFLTNSINTFDIINFNYDSIKNKSEYKLIDNTAEKDLTSANIFKFDYRTRNILHKELLNELHCI